MAFLILIVRLTLVGNDANVSLLELSIHLLSLVAQGVRHLNRLTLVGYDSNVSLLELSIH